jgi:hypothetical protein
MDDPVLTIEATPDYLLATVSGSRTIDSVRAAALAVSKAALASSLKNLLIDVTGLHGTLGPLDAFALATTTFEDLLSGGIRKIAIVDITMPPQRRGVVETIARTRGFSLRVFSTQGEAAAWLKD